MQAENDYIFKLLLIGNYGVGKTQFLIRLTENTFSDDSIPTIGVDFKNKSLEFNS